MPTLGLFMLDEDVAALDHALRNLPQHTLWEAWGAGLRTARSLHPSLSEALLADGGTQAFLRLADADGKPFGPLLQYLAARIFADDESTALRGGRLAYSNSDDPGTDDATRSAFDHVAKQAFASARSVTVPHVLRADGSKCRQYRVGRHAANWYLADPWPSRQLRDMSTLATYRLRGEGS